VCEAEQDGYRCIMAQGLTLDDHIIRAHQFLLVSSLTLQEMKMKVIKDADPNLHTFSSTIQHAIVNGHLVRGITIAPEDLTGVCHSQSSTRRAVDIITGVLPPSLKRGLTQFRQNNFK